MDKRTWTATSIGWLFFFVSFSEWSDPPPHLPFPWSCPTTPPAPSPSSQTRTRTVKTERFGSVRFGPSVVQVVRWRNAVLPHPPPVSVHDGTGPIRRPHRKHKKAASPTPKTYGSFSLHVWTIDRPGKKNRCFGPMHVYVQLQWSYVRHWKMSERPPPRSQLWMPRSKVTLERSPPRQWPDLP